jgi:uncharacterized protein
MADQGFAAMDDDKQREIASKGGQKGGKATGTGNRSSQNMSEIGKKGAQAQSTQAKAKGGHNSHRTSE